MGAAGVLLLLLLFVIIVIVIIWGDLMTCLRYWNQRLKEHSLHLGKEERATQLGWTCWHWASVSVSCW